MVGSIIVDGVLISFRNRDARLVSDQELEDIKELVALEKDSLRHRDDGIEILQQMEFISNDVDIHSARYNTVSEVTGTLEEMDDE